MSSAYQKSCLELALGLEQNSEALDKLHSLYKLPVQYRSLPPSAAVQAMEMLGIFSEESPNGLIDLPLVLGMKSNHKKIKKKLKRTTKYSGFGGIINSQPRMDIIVNETKKTYILLRGQLQLLEMVMQSHGEEEHDMKNVEDALDNVKRLMEGSLHSSAVKKSKMR